MSLVLSLKSAPEDSDAEHDVPTGRCRLKPKAMPRVPPRDDAWNNADAWNKFEGSNEEQWGTWRRCNWCGWRTYTGKGGVPQRYITIFRFCLYYMYIFFIYIYNTSICISIYVYSYKYEFLLVNIQYFQPPVSLPHWYQVCRTCAPHGYAQQDWGRAWQHPLSLSLPGRLLQQSQLPLPCSINVYTVFGSFGVDHFPNDVSKLSIYTCLKFTIAINIYIYTYLYIIRLSI